MKFRIILSMVGGVLAVGPLPGGQISESQQKWVEVYATQANIPKPGGMLVNTDPEPGLGRGFKSLCNGENLDGWTPRGGHCRFEARGGAIVGTCVPKSPSTYLSTRKDDYRDFILTAELKWEVDGNTGIMFRARAGERDGKETVLGPQAEMEAFSKKRHWSGGIYGQNCGGWFYPLWLEEHAEARKAMKRDGWNRITIMARGSTIKTWLNGVPAAHWETKEFREGFFGLQIHSGKAGTVHFRNIKVKELRKAEGTKGGGAAKKPERPNIVWLTTEDNSVHWYRLYNRHGAPMPAIERLARDGLVFNNAYSNAPVCSTARSSIISGCYVPRLGAQYHRAEMKVALPEGLKVFPWYLRQAGYHTTNNSKTDYNFSGKVEKDAWDQNSGKASYRSRKPGQPFFHVQNFTNTHEGRLFGGLAKGVERTVDPAAVKLFPYHPDTPLFREKYAQYLSTHTHTDGLIGKMVAELEAEGLLDDTFIFHYGDHGGVLPGSKGYARNDGLQVAMVVYVPKNWQHLAPAGRGTRVDGFVEFVDLSATVLNLAGVEIPEGIDGEPFLGKGVTLEELNRRDSAIGYAERFDEKYDFVRFLRKGKFTYHRSYQPFNFDGLFNEYRYKQPAYGEWRDLHAAGKLDAAQSAFFEPRAPEGLYDLEEDPHETNNLAGDPAFAPVLREMRGELRRRLASWPDVGFIPEPVMVAESGGNGHAYALRNKELIGELIAIADLQVRPFAEAKADLERALAAEHPMKRYWGLITCSAFGAQASSFHGRARRMAASDENLLVRTRAAEFLGLTGGGDPRPFLTEVLRKSTDPIEANLVLNTVVLLRDGKPGVEFDFSKVEGAAWFRKKPGIGNSVQRRIGQFRGDSQ